MPVVLFSYADTQLLYHKKTALKNFVKHLFSLENKHLNHIQYVFCTDEYLLSVNQQFLQHNYYTDIITFDLSDTPDFINAEVYISVDRIKENAQVHKVTFEAELARVVFHGALHLCGYADKTKKQQLLMRTKEDFYINLYLKDTTVSRGAK